MQSDRSLRWLRPLLSRPWLWHFDRRHVAAGASIGVFCGFIVPIGQIALALLIAMALRANLPVAAMATLVSNPLTYAPIAVLAYQTGAALLGETAEPARAAELQLDPFGEKRGWGERIAAIGRPLFAGLAVFAVVGAAIAWLLVQLVWSMATSAHKRDPPEP